MHKYDSFPTQFTDSHFQKQSLLWMPRLGKFTGLTSRSKSIYTSQNFNAFIIAYLVSSKHPVIKDDKIGNLYKW